MALPADEGAEDRVVLGMGDNNVHLVDLEGVQLAVDDSPRAMAQVLAEPLEAEVAFWDDHDVDGHTSFAMARFLERAHGWSRERLWKLRLADVRSALDTGICPWAEAAEAPPAVVGRARGAGRGRGAVAPGGRGRGRGRGRGKGRV